MNLKSIRVAITQIANVYPILPINISPEVVEVRLMPEHPQLWWPSWTELDDNGCVIGDRPGVGKAISQERIGRVLDRFSEFYEAESEDHLAPVIEHFDGSWGMSFHDAVNQANVY